MRLFSIRVAIALCLPALTEAAQHRLQIHPNPNLTILSMAQGPDGFLWLAAPEGLYRFDGFHYQRITTYPLGDPRVIATTGDGSLWIGGGEGLARLVHNKFEVVTREAVTDLAAYPDQLFARFPDGLARVGLDGSIRRLSHRTRRDLIIDSSGRLWAMCAEKPVPMACSFDPKSPEVMQTDRVPPLLQEIARDPKGQLWVADAERAFSLENGAAKLRFQRMRSPESSRPGPILSGANKQLWFLGETIRSLDASVEFHDRADHNRFAPMSGLEDHRGRLWAATLGQGLVEWIKDPNWERWFPEDFAGEPAVLIQRDQQGTMLVATHKNIYRFNDSTGKWTAIGHEQRRYEGLLPLEDGGFLASVRELGCVRLSREGVVLERVKDDSSFTEERKIIRDRKGRVWVGAKRALLRVEGQPGSLRFRKESLPGVSSGETQQAVDLVLDSSGRLWVGYGYGIAWLDDEDRWHKIETDHPITMVRSFAVAGDDVWVAHRASGGYSRLHKTGEQWKVTAFSAKAGYGPADTEFIKNDSRGWIWRGSGDGVHIADGKHFEPNDWIHIHLKNGLAANEMGQYGFFEDTDRSIWIAGDEGVTHLRPYASWFDAPHGAAAPRVTRVEADGQVSFFPSSKVDLPADTKQLHIDAATLDASAFRDFPLRYRLQPGSKDWQLSRDGSIEFRNLPPNAYHLELGFTGDGPSQVATYTLKIGERPSTAWRLWLVALLVGASAVFMLIRQLPWLDPLRFRAAKAMFLLKRRYWHRSLSSSGPDAGAPDYSGETLSGRYQLRRVISRGGFSVVYEACDLQDGQARLAVKVLNRNSREQGWVRDRFAHEVAALRSVQHPAVVRILDSWISPAGEPCLAMPFLDGPTMRSAMTESAFSFPRVARIVRQLGAALAEVHSRGIVHRDLKPENLMLRAAGTPDEQSVVIDFGTAGLRTAEGELGSTTLMAGSFHYMAPERLTGHYSPASDVFSFAVIILEMITGKRLADVNAMFSESSFRTELERTLRGSVGERSAKILADLLMKAYDPEPRRRPGEVRTWADEVAAAIDQV
jgi:ligand-binding sensor domain-containing protein